MGAPYEFLCHTFFLNKAVKQWTVHATGIVGRNVEFGGVATCVIIMLQYMCIDKDDSVVT